MRKKLFNIGFWLSFGLFIYLYSYFWFLMGKHQQTAGFLSMILLIIYVGIITLMTYYDRIYYERKDAIKIAICYSIPLAVLILVDLLIGLEMTKEGIYFIYAILFLVLIYLYAGTLRDSLDHKNERMKRILTALSMLLVVGITFTTFGWRLFGYQFYSHPNDYIVSYDYTIDNKARITISAPSNDLDLKVVKYHYENDVLEIGARFGYSLFEEPDPTEVYYIDVDDSFYKIIVKGAFTQKEIYIN